MAKKKRMVKSMQPMRSATMNNSAGPRLLSALVGLAVWIAGVLVSLAVGFGMIDGRLPIWGIPEVVTAIAGWVVVILTIVGAILAIIDRLA